MRSSSRSGSKTPVSRHVRFVAIMEEAAGKATADYNGYGRFWNLPLPELRRVTLYGIAMMAAAADGTGSGPPTMPAAKPCCGGSSAGGSRSGSSATPGLILGLRGLSPFDGTQFPPLPWGGKRVAEDDITFIAGWIADGCPSEDADDNAKAKRGDEQVSDAKAHALASGTAQHPVSAVPINQLAADAGTLKVRKNIAYLTDDELSRLRAAIAQMKKLDPYYQDQRSFAYWARIHANQCQHGWEEFLTWHRAYLYGFEKALQYFDRTVTLPYWDWAADAVNVKIALQDMGPSAVLDNGYVPPAFQCWMDETHLKSLSDGGKVSEAALVGLGKILNTSYSSGSRLLTAAGIKFGIDPVSDATIIAALADINSLWHWRRWPGGNSSVIFEAYPTPDDVDRILEIDSFFTFGSGPIDDQHFGALETVHNLIHNFSGGLSPYPDIGPNNPAPVGDMVDSGRTAFDPIFWMHHTNIDRLWAQWQRNFPSVGPDNPHAILPPWSFTVDDMKSTRALGYDYMMNAHVFPTDNTVPIARFASAPTAIHESAITNHRAAQVRLHAVQYVTRPGFYIRVFLNQPDATLATPTKGNPHYVGQVSMFTGACVGGPGHCDVPIPSSDPFDLRPRPHKTPSSFHLDATAAIRALGAEAAALQVNVFAFNLDGSPAGDALKLDAVSLVFFD